MLDTGYSMRDVRHSEPFALLKGKVREESVRNVIARSETTKQSQKIINYQYLSSSETKESIAGLRAIR